jgi:hypothetical protein
MPIEPLENLSRYIFQSNHIRPSDGTVKFAAFMPDRNGETSVFRTSGMSEQNIWEIGNCEVAIRRGKPLLGRADILAREVLARHLEVDPSEPPPRHANIVAWPDEKSKRHLIALELAAVAKFCSTPLT